MHSLPKKATMKHSVASCRAASACRWMRYAFTSPVSCAFSLAIFPMISRTRRWKQSLGINISTPFWYFLISFRALAPGLRRRFCFGFRMRLAHYASMYYPFALPWLPPECALIQFGLLDRPSQLGSGGHIEQYSHARYEPP